MKTIENSPSGEKMIKKLPTVIANVKQILIEYPSTKGDDRLLHYRYLKKHHPYIKITFKDFKMLFTTPSIETLTRARRKLQETDPSLKPTERTQHKRFNRQRAYANYYSPVHRLMDFE